MYDIFISFKYTDTRSGEISEDYKIAKAIYEDLTARGYKVFFSPVSLHVSGDTEWKDAIEKAVKSTNYMILVGTSVENIKSEQVKREWSTLFLEEKINGRKPFAQLITCIKGFSMKELPAMLLNGKQVYDCEKVSIEYICDSVENKLGKKSGSGTAAIPEQRDLGDRDYKYRFKYTAGYTRLKGRDSEIAFLKDFCGEEGVPVSWTAVYGKGGVGKSKLAYEFCNMMEPEGWKAWVPSHARAEGEYIRKEISEISADTLICFDYVKYELDYVEDIIRYAIENTKLASYKIRFLLIERNKEDMEGSFAARVQNCQYSKGCLELEPLDDGSILEIIEDYKNSAGCNKAISEDDGKLLIDTLEAIDPGIHRPLFALFIADAWIDSDEKLRRWDRESALDYVTDKEIDRTDKAAKDIAKSPVTEKQYLTALRSAVILATFCGEVPCADIIAKCSEMFDVPESILRQMTRDSGILAGDNLRGIEPDLVGEYMCLKMMSMMEMSAVDALFEVLMGMYFLSTIAFVDKIYSDYKDMFLMAEWRHHCTDITVPDSISRIGANMFRGVGFINSMHLHKHVAAIAKGAFRECENLRTINFPDDLEIIDDDAFRDCAVLETALTDDETGWIPSIEHIGERAFMNCHSLRNLIIPNSVKTIGCYAFSGCEKIESVFIPQDLDTIEPATFMNCSSLNFILFVETREKAANVRVLENAFKGCSNLEEIKGSRIIHLGKSAFEDCVKLETVLLSGNCTKLSDRVFLGCNSLKRIDLSNTSIMSIGDECFENCPQLEDIVLPEKIRKIGARCFFGCVKLSGIYLPPGLKSIGARAFCGCMGFHIASRDIADPTGIDFCGFRTQALDRDTLRFITTYDEMEKVEIPPSITAIGKRAFCNIRTVEEITVREGVTAIGEEAFSGCTNLKRIKGTFSGIESIGKAAFRDCRSLTEIPSDAELEIIPEEAFSGCSSIEKLCFSSNIRNIGRQAFSDCVSLSSLEFKDRCEEVGALAFYNCTSLTLSEEEHITDRDGLYYLGGFIFSSLGPEEFAFIKDYSSQTDLQIPESCVGFFDNPFGRSEKTSHIFIPEKVHIFIRYNFSGMTALRSIDLPAHIEGIKTGFFKNCCSLETVRVGGGKINSFPDGMILEPRAFENCRALKHIEIPKGTENLNWGIFRNCVSLTKVDIPEGVNTLGKNAFEGCISLREIKMPNSLITLENAVFKNCCMLENIELPEGLIFIGADAFSGCSSLKEIDLFKTSLMDIGAGAFQNCSKIRKLIIPPGVKWINQYTFRSCTQLQMVILPPGLNGIMEGAFYGCTELASADLSNMSSLESIGDHAFFDCQNIIRMVIPEGITSLPRGLFSGCIKLEEVSFAAGISIIPADCFKNCRKLKNIVNPGSIEMVGDGAFRNCFSITDHSPFKHASEFGEGAFRGCVSLESVSLDNVNTIAPALFLGCVNLRTVEFAAVGRIGKYAFSGCTVLADIPLQNVRHEIEYGAFWNCSKLSDISFSESLYRINASAFRNCISVKVLDFPQNITNIHPSAFRNAEALTKVTFRAPKVAILKSAFRDCKKLNSADFECEYALIFFMAFAGCASLYYVMHNDCTITADKTAFEGVPAQRSLAADPDIEWEDVIDKSLYYYFSHKEVKGIHKPDYAYEISDGRVSIKRYFVDSDTIVVPEEISGYPVKYIGEGCFRDRRELEKVTIPDSVESIGKNAFKGCEKLMSAELGKNIMNIGKNAFMDCTMLEHIQLPEGIKELNQSLFVHCSSLKTLTIPAGVRVIRSGAFLDCINLHITVPSSVEIIETGAFTGCDRTTVCFESGADEKYFDRNDYAYEISDGIVRINRCLRESDTIVVPEEIDGHPVRHIGEGCFKYRREIEKVIIPDSVESIGKDAFKGCKKLMSAELGKNIKDIGENAFMDCTMLEHIQLPEGIKELRRGLFVHCYGLKTLTIPAGVRVIRSGAFHNCSNLNITIPSSVEIIETGAFKGCDINNVCFENGADENYFNRNDYAYEISDGIVRINRYLRESDTIVVPEKIDGHPVRHIGEGCFRHRKGIEKVIIPDSVESIGKDAFKGCEKLMSAELGKNIKDIGENAFTDCIMLEHIQLPEGISELSQGLFMNCSGLKTLTIPAGVREIRSGAFRNCSNLNITIPSSVEIIETGAFAGCDINTVCFESGTDENYFDIPDYIYKISDGIVRINKCLRESDTIAVPEKIDGHPVRHIGEGCFKYRREIEKVIIPDSVESIGKDAFKGCKKLMSAELGKNIKDIGENAFMDCTMLEHIQLPEGIKELRQGLFVRCYGLKTLTIPAGVREIRSGAFRNCSNLNITVPSSVEIIEKGAFKGCDINNVCFENGAEEKYFDGTSYEVRLSIEDDIPEGAECYDYSISDGEVYLWKYKGRNVRVVIPEYIEELPVRYICESCFEKNKRIIEVILPESVVFIGESAFSGCKNLQKIKFGKEVREIGKYAFNWCKRLKTMDLPEKISIIDAGTFMCCFKLETLRIPESVRCISTHAFWRCDHLTLTVPATVASIATGAFKDCNREDIHIENGSKDRYFEEWPFGEKVIDDEKGEGVICSCRYTGDNSYEVEVEYSDQRETLIYPAEFGESKHFAYGSARKRHNNLLKKISMQKKGYVVTRQK